VPREDPIVYFGYESMPWPAVSSTLLEICRAEIGNLREHQILRNTEARVFVFISFGGETSRFSGANYRCCFQRLPIAMHAIHTTRSTPAYRDPKSI
jgi:hypothetical protein